MPRARRLLNIQKRWGSILLNELSNLQAHHTVVNIDNLHSDLLRLVEITKTEKVEIQQLNDKIGVLNHVMSHTT
jgi:hypothetical protein